MKEKVIEYFKNNKDAILSDISKLVAIPSVRGEAKYGMPFGEEPAKALYEALNIADGFELKTKNYDGYVGTVDMNTENTELAILAHLDVVPAGDGWHSEPFKMKIESDRIIGRGTSDDKGAAVAALYAMKAVKDLNIPISKNCRLILGTDEECGSGDLKYYFSKESAPKYSFTPDAEFPVTNGEKGRFTKHFTKSCDFSDERRRIVSINAGEASNAVPGFAEAQVIGVNDTELEKAAKLSENTGCKFEINSGKIICRGKSTHASLPESGCNPITALFDMLSNVEFDEKTNEFADSLKALFPHGKYNGEAFGVNMSDKLGELTMSLDTVSFDSESFDGCFDTRTPMCANEKNCAAVIAGKLAEYGFKIENTEMIKPHYVDENSEFIKALLKNYELFSGEKGECVCMGGGTYVHDIDGGVAFGAISRDVQTNMHGSDEFMLIRDILMSAEIFTCVIAEMCK
jgi:succinyl-diaminopimelate desuccinylase